VRTFAVLDEVDRSGVPSFWVGELDICIYTGYAPMIWENTCYETGGNSAVVYKHFALS
jgi:hypothetical protein